MRISNFNLVLITFFIISIPVLVGAIGVPATLPFGGYAQTIIPCTCSSGEIIVYRNLFTGIKMVPGGALYRPVIAKSYANFTSGAPFVWYVGSYVPNVGISQFECMTGIPPACIPAPYPTLGTIKYSGTSRVGFGVTGF